MSDLYAVAMGGVLGIAGAAIGQIISGYKDKRRWLADSRKEEYRELMKALTRSATMWMYYRGSALTNEKDFEATNEAYMDSLRVIHDRIFIAEEVEKARVYDRWTEAIQKLGQSKNVGSFSDEFEGLRHAILESALKRSIKKALR